MRRCLAELSDCSCLMELFKYHDFILKPRRPYSISTTSTFNVIMIRWLSSRMAVIFILLSNSVYLRYFLISRIGKFDII